jgi:hypothetical protein
MAVKTNSAGTVTPSKQFKPTATKTTTPSPVANTPTTAPQTGAYVGSIFIPATPVVTPTPIVKPTPKASTTPKAKTPIVEEPKTELPKADAKDKVLSAVVPTVIDTYTDAKGDRIAVMSDGTTKNLGATVNDSKQVNAIESLASLYKSYGLSSDIATSLAELVKKDYSADTIAAIAQDPNSKDPIAVAMQQRFAGNAGRIKLGLAPYDPKTYIGIENQFASAIKEAGLPTGFYDSQSDWANWIGSGVSPAEATRRVSLASDILINKDPSYLDQMQNLYGLDKSHALAYLLDSNKALPLIEKQVNAVKFAAAAQKAGVGVNKNLAEQYAALGVTEAQANKGFQSIAGDLAERQRLAEMQGIDAGSIGNKLISATFTGGGTDIGGAAAAEIGKFSGSAGAGKGTLGVEQTGIL